MIAFRIIAFLVVLVHPLLADIEELNKDASSYCVTVETRVFELTNLERTKRGLKALRWHQALRHIARYHGINQMKHKFYAHRDHKGMEPTDRFRRLHPAIMGSVGENIHKIWVVKERNAEGTAQYLVKEWMQSPGHRANILHTRYNYLGVGVVSDGKHIWGTQNFGDLYAESVQTGAVEAVYGSRFSSLFRLLDVRMRSVLSATLFFPDSSRIYPISGGEFYTGSRPVQPQWSMDAAYFSVAFPLEYGRGRYRIRFGPNGQYYPNVGVDVLAK